MKVLISGDREWTDASLIGAWLDNLGATLVIEGECRGADLLARQEAERRGIPVSGKPADWNKHKKAAGPIRNREMLKECPDVVVAFHDNIEGSKGTADMIKAAREAGFLTILVSHSCVKRYEALVGFF